MSILSYFKKLIDIRKYKIPKTYTDIWYNQAAYMDRKYPVIFDSSKSYIRCTVGLKVVMGETVDGRKIYYEVTRITHSRGSDWLYQSDSVNCDLKFSHIQNKN